MVTCQLALVVLHCPQNKYCCDTFNMGAVFTECTKDEQQICDPFFFFFAITDVETSRHHANMADNCMDQRNGWRDPKEKGQMLFIIRFLGVIMC
jgi:hypothetical protein